MILFSLILALGLMATADSFKFQSEEYVYSDYFDKRCFKALTGDIECNDRTRMLGSSAVAGWVGSNATADGACTSTCFDSLQRWNESVTKECTRDMNRAYPPRQLEDTVKLANEVRQMWNATCIRDTKSGRYCFDVVDEIRGSQTYGKKTPFKEPCHPCYGMVVSAMLNSSIEVEVWSLDNDYWKGQLELVHDKCGGPDKIEKNLEEQRIYNASHPREPELMKNNGMTSRVNHIGVWIAVLIYGCSVFMSQTI
ncbi:hypothetical protein FPSE_07835 [Fusarium pseudograminearum CS3096]|uniref:Uncharacterized protein n=1 Tax=Fusarium pseudograminearum (strain CS3096) TaxID=1028729 RepID=K3UJ69_FUSPC|nr:hypothetical protein FPSE_07835 [Fusarium pseudograminearum CS3096]EKJ71981.1 hypothetical protein FPSE_07835 [Fusarium pseudograminearum CS3096]